MVVVITKSFVFILCNIFGTRKKPLRQANQCRTDKQERFVCAFTGLPQPDYLQWLCTLLSWQLQHQHQHSVGFGQTGSGYIGCEI